MHSRSRLLIERDYRKLQECKPWGIDAHPLTDDNWFQWTAVIQGLRNTDWEGGTFRLYIQFDDCYNDQPPKICFHSIPFHPNIDVITGRPSIDFLLDSTKWNSSLDLTHVLVAVQKLLSHPCLNEADVVNSEAANLLLQYPSIYQQTVYQCVAASQTLEDHESRNNYTESSAVTPKLLYRKTTSTDAPVVQTKVQSAVPSYRHRFIPFEDYYSTWNAIATSKTVCPDDSLIDQQSSRNVPGRSRTQTRISTAYNNSTSNNSKNSCQCQRSAVLKPHVAKQSKMEHIERMRQLYLQRPHTSTPRQLVTQRSEPSSSSNVRRHETPGNMQSAEHNFEQEVDELVSWTDKLDV